MTRTRQRRPTTHPTQLLVLELTGDLGTYVDVLRAEREIGEVVRHGNRIVVRSEDAQAVLPRVIDLAARLGVQIVGVLVSPQALEAGGIEAQYLAEVTGERGEGELA
jgi:hypothetical protein